MIAAVYARKSTDQSGVAATESSPSAADGEADKRTGHWLIIAIAHFNDGRDCGLRLNGIDRAFTV